MRFLDGNPPSRRERVIMALDVIIHREIMADEDVAAGEKASRTHKNCDANSQEKRSQFIAANV